MGTTSERSRLHVPSNVRAERRWAEAISTIPPEDGDEVIQALDTDSGVQAILIGPATEIREQASGGRAIRPAGGVTRVAGGRRERSQVVSAPVVLVRIGGSCT